MKVFAVVPLLCATLVSSRVLKLTQPEEISLNPQYPVPGDNPLEFCANPRFYPGEIDHVDLVPNPPVPGETLHISISGMLEEELGEGTKVQIRVKYRKYITLINQTFDLCSNLPKIDKECPLEKGELTIERDADIPAVVPPGVYEIYANVINEKKRSVLCMETTIEF